MNDLKSKRNDNPPPWLLHFFRWYCHPNYQEDIEGDLRERFERNVEEKGSRWAKWRFFKEVLHLFRPGIIRALGGTYTLNHYGMFKNYLKISWRNIAKNKVFSLINISGLSLGLTCSILIALWVLDEYRVNTFHENIDQIYKVTSRIYSENEITGGYGTPGLLAEELKNVVPEVELASGISWTSWNTLAVDDNIMKLPGTYAGEDFFKIFSYPILLGTKEDALKSPESIAISRKMALLFFDSPEDAIGKSIKFENQQELKVTAVFEDLKDNSSMRFLYLMNWEFFMDGNKWIKDWNSPSTTTFVKLKKDVNTGNVSSKIQHFLRNYTDEYSDFHRHELGLQPFRDSYLYSNFENGKISGGRIEYVKMFRLIAIIILLLACINFMNLSTARSVKRAKEIGVRKVIGAMRSSLISQFILDAFLFTFIAILFSLILLIFFLPQFNLLTGKNIQYPVSDGTFWIGLIILMLVTGIIAGSYPAFVLSSFKPVAAIKSNVKMKSSSGIFRKGLVVFQFSLSMIFIVGMIVISSQVNYIQNKNLGYQKNNLIYLAISGKMKNNFDVFKNEALKIPGIESISKMSQRPLELENSTFEVEWEGKVPDTKPSFAQAAVGYDFIKTMQSSLVSGRDFAEDFADKKNYLINEAALKIIGYKDPIGMPLSLDGVDGKIIGVVKDFHFNSLHVPIKPMILRLSVWRSRGYALIRINPEKMQESLTKLEELHDKFNPEFAFAHQFADEEYGYLYQSEKVIARLSRYFAFFAITISCLGLLGLVIFMAEQRVKEIGIRKVLGAKATQIITLLSKDFMKLIGIAVVLSTPVAYYVMNDWLQSFEYHIQIQWWMFVLASLGSVIIALLTISYQSIKAALMNPVKSLRSE